jgi:CAI-1 autoinducer synthase
MRAMCVSAGELGYNVSDGTEQIIALEGPEPNAGLRKALERQGVWRHVLRPGHAKNRSLVRLTLNSGLTAAQLAQIIAACAAVREQLDWQNWSSTRRLRKLALV